MKRIISIVLLTVVTAAAFLGLTGCGKYTSSYVATTCITSSDSDSGKVSFGGLKGTMVFTAKCDGKEGRQIKYSAKLDSGSFTVYYDSDGTKTELFTISGGETVEASGGELVKGTVYIILETDGKCEEGNFSFEIE